jgi:hypothetical protein
VLFGHRVENKQKKRLAMERFKELKLKRARAMMEK